MTSVAVVGAGGFVGSRLMELAMIEPAWTFVPVLRSAKSMARLSKLGIKPLFANTSDANALASSLAGFDVVINLAMGDYSRIQADAEMVYEATHQARARLLVHISSAAVFGLVPKPDTHDDSSPQLKHWMLYARGKGAAENCLRERMGRSGPEVVVLRPGVIWGPRSSWSTLPAKQLASGAAWLGGGGSGVCNLCHVDNLVRYILQVLRAPEPVSGFFNIADPGTITWRKYYESVANGLSYPLNRIHETQAGPRRLSLGALLDLLMQEAFSYRLIKMRLLPWMSMESIARLKFHLPGLVGGALQPPVPGDIDQADPGPPRLTRELWSLQNTRHPLPTEKFVRQFGDPGLMSFEEGLATTVNWLKFAGFAA